MSISNSSFTYSSFALEKETYYLNRAQKTVDSLVKAYEEKADLLKLTPQSKQALTERIQDLANHILLSKVPKMCTRGDDDHQILQEISRDRFNLECDAERFIKENGIFQAASL